MIEFTDFPLEINQLIYHHAYDPFTDLLDNKTDWVALRAHFGLPKSTPLRIMICFEGFEMCKGHTRNMTFIKSEIKRALYRDLRIKTVKRKFWAYLLALDMKVDFDALWGDWQIYHTLTRRDRQHLWHRAQILLVTYATIVDTDYTPRFLRKFNKAADIAVLDAIPRVA